MLPNLHLLGIQGSGKGTQSALLVERYGLTYIPSGNLLRERAQRPDQLGEAIGRELNQGHLVMDNLLYQTVDGFLKENPVKTGVLGDGVIRTVTQYHLLQPLWAEHGLELPVLINLVLDQSTALERIKIRQKEAAAGLKRDFFKVYGGKILKRQDDHPAAVDERFKIFHQMTEPVVKLFQTEGRCLQVDADQSVTEIQTVICAFIDRLYPSLSHASD